MNRCIAKTSIAILLLFSLCANAAEGGSPPATTAPAAAANDSKTDSASSNTLDRRSPRDTVKGFLDATSTGNAELAADFLESIGSRAQTSAAAPKLRAVIDRQVWVDLASISDDPEGRRDDGLVANRDSLGWLDTPDGPREVVLERLERAGGQRWLFSKETVAAAVRVYDVFGYGRLVSRLPAPLRDYQLLHVQLWQWIALFLLVLAAYVISLLATRLGVRVLAPLARRTHTKIDDRLLALATGPIRLMVAVAIFSAGRLPLGLTAAARTVLGAAEYILIVAAAAWFILRVVDVVGEVFRNTLVRRGQTGVLNLIPPGERTAKVCIVGLAVIALLDGFGFNVTTLLAGLGVGGIAVALAAQKSIENLFGGVTLYADQPVRVGDTCRFGTTSGTVEDIGLRSTRVRTAERTVVTIPNADFANLQLENISKRDKFLFHPTIGLRHETTPEQLRQVLEETRRMLSEHVKIEPHSARVRFTGIGASSLDIEISAYILTNENEFFDIRGDLNLRLMSIVAAAGTGFAFPSGTVYVEPRAQFDEERHSNREREPGDEPRALAYRAKQSSDVAGRNGQKGTRTA